MPIIDDNGSVIGIITAIDILRAIRDGKDLNTLLVRDLMTQNPSVVNQNTKIEEVITFFFTLTYIYHRKLLIN
jgi:predicted transcriptional regulator